jgi:RNA polymerase-binding transcription factor DksA
MSHTTQVEMLHHRREALLRLLDDPRRTVRATYALRRIDEGTYGFCLGCWLKIPEAQLAERPERTHCSRCRSG